MVLSLLRRIASCGLYCVALFSGLLVSLGLMGWFLLLFVTVALCF